MTDTETQADLPVDDTTEAAAPESAPAKTPESEGAETEEHQVPVASLTKERQKWKDRLSAAEKRAQEIEERYEQRWQAMVKAVGGESDKTNGDGRPQIPDYEEAPLDHLRTRLDQVARAQEERQKAEQAQTALNRVKVQLNAVQQEFAKEHPDYMDAIQFATQARVAELKLLHGIDDAQAQQAVGAEQLQLSYQMMQQGKNPAEAFYNYSKQRGYQPKQDDTPTAEDIAQRQRETRAVGTSGGRPAKTQWTFAALAKLDPVKNPADAAKWAEGMAYLKSRSI